MRNSQTVAIHKCTWEAVFDGITTMYAKTFTKANAQKINYKPESGRVHNPVGVGFAGIELPAIKIIASGDMTPDEVGNMSDHDYHLSIVAAVTSRPASIEDFKTLYDGRRPHGGPAYFFRNEGAVQRLQFAGNQNTAPEQIKSNYRQPQPAATACPS